jgi:hypothetical protein
MTIQLKQKIPARVHVMRHMKAERLDHHVEHAIVQGRHGRLILTEETNRIGGAYVTTQHVTSLER